MFIDRPKQFDLSLVITKYKTSYTLAFQVICYPTASVNYIVRELTNFTVRKIM